MTIEEFNEVLLFPLLIEHKEYKLSGDDMENIYYLFRDSLEHIKIVTKAQKDCFELYYGLKMTQRKVAEYLNIRQATVSEHIAKAKEAYLRLLDIEVYIYVHTPPLTKGDKDYD